MMKKKVEYQIFITPFLPMEKKTQLLCEEQRMDVENLIPNRYNNRGLFCDPNIIANNKERCFRNPAVANHNSSQILKLLRYHNIRTRTIASPS